MKKKNIVGITVAAAAVIAVGIVLFLLNGCFNDGTHIYEDNVQKCTNQRTSDAVITDWLVNDKGFDIDAFKAKYTIEEIIISSSVDGHAIPASYIYAEGSTGKSGNTVVMVHGLLGNRLSNYPMAQLFLDLGYNVITYDQRSSGGNTAPYTTFGFYESTDAADYAAFARENMAEASKLGFWGQSMGAATVENALDTDIFLSGVDFVVLDSPMGNFEDFFYGAGLSKKIAVAYASSLSKKNVGYSYAEQRVEDELQATEIPVMVVCSKADSSIPYAAEERIFNMTASKNKVLYAVEDSDHSDIYFDHPQDYSKQLTDFIGSIN